MSANAAATVVILCPEPALALQWRELLTTASGLRVAGISNSPSSVRAMVKQHGVDLILADLRMLQGTRNGALRSLRSAGSEDTPLIVVVGDRLDDPLLLDALRGGADNFHVPGPNPFALAEAVQRTLDGESFIEPAIAAQVLDQFDRTAPQGNDDPLSNNTLLLTAPERSLLVRVAQGRAVAQIAEAEAIPLRQMGALVRSTYRKLRWNLRANALSLEEDQSFRDSGWAALQPGRRSPRG